MEWSDTAKLFVVMVAAGVVTAIAIEAVTGRLKALAVQTSRAELQRLMLAATQQQATSPVTEQTSNAPTVLGTTTML